MKDQSKSTNKIETSRSTDLSNRQFNDLPTKFGKNLTIPDYNQIDSTKTTEKDQPEADDLYELIRNSEIGCDQKFSGPFGLRKVTYCDYTATGRSLSFIEDFIREEVLPEYGNTHTTSTITSLQTTLFRNEAK